MRSPSCHLKTHFPCVKNVSKIRVCASIPGILNHMKPPSPQNQSLALPNVDSTSSFVEEKGKMRKFLGWFIPCFRKYDHADSVNRLMSLPKDVGNNNRLGAVPDHQAGTHGIVVTPAPNIEISQNIEHDHYHHQHSKLYDLFHRIRHRKEENENDILGGDVSVQPSVLSTRCEFEEKLDSEGNNVVEGKNIQEEGVNTGEKIAKTLLLLNLA